MTELIGSDWRDSCRGRRGGRPATEALEGLVDAMSPTRAQRAAALGAWTDDGGGDDLVEAGTDELEAIARYAARRDHLETALADAIRIARRNGRSWSQIGARLGVSKQAAQRKYSKLTS